jgi:hypothetical protein
MSVVRRALSNPEILRTQAVWYRQAEAHFKRDDNFNYAMHYGVTALILENAANDIQALKDALARAADEPNIDKARAIADSVLFQARGTSP